MSSAVDRDGHNERQIDYFASRYKKTMQPRSTRYVERQVDEFLRLTNLPKEAQVLEVGCGIGKYTIPLLRRGFRIEGLDLTPELLVQMRTHLPEGTEIPLHACDIATFPDTCSRRFDAVIGFFAAHHFHDLTICFRAMARLVKPGGLVAFLEPNGRNPLYYVQMAVTPGMTWQGDGGVVQMRPGPMFRAMGAAGLVDLGVDRFGFFPPFLSNRPLGARVEEQLERVPLLRPILPFQVFQGRAPTPGVGSEL